MHTTKDPVSISTQRGKLRIFVHYLASSRSRDINAVKYISREKSALLTRSTCSRSLISALNEFHILLSFLQRDNKNSRDLNARSLFNYFPLKLFEYGKLLVVSVFCKSRLTFNLKYSVSLSLSACRRKVFTSQLFSLKVKRARLAS